MKSIATIVTVLSGLVFASAASADTAVYRAASNYRKAVRDFEDTVRHLRYVPKYEERLVDQFEDSTSVLRDAARRYDRLDRLQYAWDTTRSLQVRVESTVVAQYGADPSLARAWNRVCYAYRSLSREVNGLLRAPYGVNVPSPPVQINPRVPVPNYNPPILNSPSPRVQTRLELDFGRSRGNAYDRSYRDDRSRRLTEDYRKLDRTPVRVVSQVDIRSRAIGAVLSRLAR